MDDKNSPMPLLTLEQYFMGRDADYPLNEGLIKNASSVILRANLLLHFFGEYRHITSGYRPKEINDKIPGAAKNSLHMICMAVDLEDHGQRLSHFCIENKDSLIQARLWMESPKPGAKHCHLQIIPPLSGKRVFIA